MSSPTEKIFKLNTHDALWKDFHPWFVDAYYSAVKEENEHSQAHKFRSMDEHARESVSEMLQAVVRDESRACLFSAQVENKWVGYFLGMIKDCLGENPGRVGYVNGLYVAPSHRSTGIGQRLLDRGNEWFRNQNLNSVELYTAINNKGAIRFWEKNGYAAIEVVMIAKL